MRESQVYLDWFRRGRLSAGLRLVDPRFDHLDTALCVLGDDVAAYYPAAFEDAGRAALAGQLSAAGFGPVPVDLSELLKAGGGAEGRTPELRY